MARSPRAGGALLNARAQEPPREDGRYVVKATGPSMLLGQYASLNPRANLAGGVAGARQLSEFKKTAAVRAGLNDLLGRASSKPANLNRSDAYYGRVLKKYQQLATRQMAPGDSAHFESRHGASTTIEDQWMRANHKIIPGTKGLKKDKTYRPSSRFLSYKDQYDTIKEAVKKRKEGIIKGTFENPVNVAMGRVIGEGYLAESSTVLHTKTALVFFDLKGVPYTAYPDLKALE